jgi:ABC-type glycerol-3-phosphate transport system substrate-binding protein
MLNGLIRYCICQIWLIGVEMHTRLFLRTTLLLVSCLALAACGGGGKKTTDTPAPPVDTTMNWDDDNWDEKDWQ